MRTPRRPFVVSAAGGFARPKAQLLALVQAIVAARTATTAVPTTTPARAPIGVMTVTPANPSVSAWPTVFTVTQVTPCLETDGVRFEARFAPPLPPYDSSAWTVRFAAGDAVTGLAPPLTFPLGSLYVPGYAYPLQAYCSMGPGASVLLGFEVFVVPSA